MSRKTLSYLAIALVLVTGAIFLLLPEQTGRETLRDAPVLLEGLEERVNAVDRVVVTGPGSTVLATLERDAAAWRIAELSAYPADLETVRDVLGGLAEAEVIEAKTGNPEYYARLGVEDVSDPAASGTRLDLSAGEAAWAVILGKEAPNRGGRYLREVETPGSVLADFDADVPADAAAWADRTVVDLMAAEVAEVRITQPDGETVTALKVSADDTDFRLAEMPDGRETKSAWSVNSLGSAFSTLDFESVRTADELDWSDAIVLRALRFDGLELEARLLRLGDNGDWLWLEASAPPVPEATEGASTEDDAGDPEVAGDALGDGSGREDGVDEAAIVARVAAAADAINERVSGWAYRIPAYKADAMDKRVADLLKEPVEDGTAGAD